MSLLGVRRRSVSARQSAPPSECEPLELRLLLAGNPFPPPAFLGTFDGGWDFVADRSTGNLPTTLDGKNYAPGARPEYTLEIDAASGSIPLLSVNWGESAAAGTGPILSDVYVSVFAGKYATGLLEAVASNRDLPLMTIRAYDAQDRESRRWILQDGDITTFQVSEAADDQTPPIDSFSLHFNKITAQTIAYDVAGNPLPPRSVEYDVAKNKGTDVDFGGATFAPGAEPQQLLDLGTGQIAIHNVSWALSGPIGDPGSIIPATPQDFTFISDGGPATLGLLSAVYTANPMGHATFSTRDDAGRVVAQWKLDGVLVTSYQTSNSPGATPLDSFSLHADRVQLIRYVYSTAGQLTATFGAGWDFVLNKSIGGLTTTLAGNAYPAGAEPANALQIDGSALLIPVDSFTWGESNPGGPVGTATMDQFTVALPQGAYSTGLFKETIQQPHHSEIDIITRNAAGKETMRWILTAAFVTSYSSSDSADDAQGPSDAITISFAKIRAEYTPYANNGSPLPKIVAEWDIVGNNGSGAALVGNTYAPGTEPRLALEIGTTSIPVDSMNQSLGRSAGGPAGRESSLPTATPFGISIAQGRWSPGIFASVAAATNYPAAALVSRDATGRVTARWKLTNFQLAFYQTASQSQPAATGENVGLAFSSIERVVEEFNPTTGTTQVYAGGFNFVTQKPTPPGATLGSTLRGETYPAGAEPDYTLAITGETGLIPVQAVSWSEFEPPSVGANPILNQFALVLPAGRYDTGLVAAATFGVARTMTLVRRDSLGRPVTRYTLTGALFTGFTTQESPGQAVLNFVTLNFTKLQVERLDYTPGGMPLPPVEVEWDLQTNKGTLTDFGGQTFAPGTEPETVLDLGSGQVAVSSFTWGESRSGDNPASAQDFTVSIPAGPASLGILSSVPPATRYPQVLITTRDPDGHIITQWRLTDVELSSYQISGAVGAGPPQETATLRFRTIELIYNAYAPAVIVEAVTPTPRNTAVPSLVLRFSEPVTGVDLTDLQLTRNGGPNLLTAQQTLVASDAGRTWTLGNLTGLTSAADGTYTFTISTALAAGIVGQFTTEPLVQASGAQWTLDRVAPTLSAKTFDYVASPNRVQITFSEDVGASLVKDDLSVKPLNAGAPPVPAFSGFTYDPTTHAAVWTFASNLRDGDYRATLAAGSVADLASNPLALSTLDFFAFAADANHDRNVDFNDLVVLAQNYNTTGKTFAQGNFNYDPEGNVDFNDLVILAQRYNTKLPSPGAPVPAAPVTVSFAADWAKALALPAPAKPAPHKPKVVQKPLFSDEPPITISKNPRRAQPRQKSPVNHRCFNR